MSNIAEKPFDELRARKWAKFIRRAKLFNSVPFVDFTLAAGSMALGNPHEHSDFDVLVGVRKGRIFTARFFAVAVFGMRGWRRKKGHDKNADPKSVSDKICLSHWVTEDSHRLQGPHNEYWDKLYRSLVPLTGEAEKINNFFDANDWVSEPRDWHPFDSAQGKPDERFNASGPTLFRRAVELALRGKLGDLVESALKAYQVKRIEGGLNDKNHHKPRIIYSDHELEFHPNTRRIEEMIANNRL